ncbi:LysR family transcriptional regulator [Paraburkholderia phenoliruptrix]|uniref:LysR family transcriptional regulator n=2 Tax=Paraburkholderia phenoliruptrix TaxID=252970 RepID=K0DQT6_9BURK|nr:LysR substrate-binding domain-containing protein [Paraburkholderia phenoliruptrix]AFT86258.1 LysR family transcriptional regulator [Paraburkholderia phenoliruptrix BR3459a]CAB4048817.1 HTH-type transcriptional regulator HdfR [Paraburkholderia phenoliruptrix]
MEIKQLQHFSRIAEIGNLTRAASVLGVTQAALSRQVAQLEAELGTELFRRNGRGLVLTDAGRRLLDQVPMVLRQIAIAERAVKGTTGPVQGTFVLGLAPSLARTVVVPLIQAFREQLPEVTLRTVDGTSANLGELVGAGKLDCAVIYNPIASDAVDLRPLASESLYLVSGPQAAREGRVPASSVRLEAIPELPLVIAGKSNVVHGALAAALAERGLTAQVVHEIENLTAILDLIRHGYGYSVIPLSGVQPCIGDPELRLHRINSPGLEVGLSIATPVRAGSDTLISESTSLLREVVLKELQRYQIEVETAIYEQSVAPAGTRTTAKTGRGSRQ